MRLRVAGSRVCRVGVLEIMCHSGHRGRLQGPCCKVQLAILNGVHDRNVIAGIDQSIALVKDWAIGVS